MEMINVLKRLAELDAMTPNVKTEGAKPDFLDMDKDGNKHEPMKKAIKDKEKNVDEDELDESSDALVDECGGMMSSTGQSHTPASINITAGSGEELTGMLKDIVKLAGVGDDTAHSDTAVLSPTPTLGIATTDGEAMRSVIDKLHDTDDMDSYDDEKQVEEYDNTPGSAHPENNYDADQLAYHPNTPGAANGRATMNNPRGVPTYEQIETALYAEYQKYLSEN